MERILSRVGGADRLAWVVFILGTIIRFYNFTGMGLWIDEGYSIMFMRMPWVDVLGLHGAYDSHPPLYWATAKLLTLFMPELAAGRIVSVICGSLTLPVVYFLAKRLAGSPIALFAVITLAVSPLHVWYSQEARMFAPSMLFVALSYLSLVEYYFEPKRKWAIWYGVSVLLAMYVSYSSLYALVPQAVLFFLLIRKYNRASLPLFVGLGGAILLYLPWVPQWLNSIATADPNRVNYLGVDPRKVVFQMMEISGLAERGFFLSQTQLPWESARYLYRIFLGGAALAGLVGMVVLFVRAKLSIVVPVILWLGTVGACIALSIVSPGFASRTTLAALLGWVIVAGAAAVGGKIPVWARAAGVVGYIIVIAFSLVSVQQIYSNAFKQDWQSMASDVSAVSPRPEEMLIVRDVDETIIDSYFPGTLNRVTVTDTSQLTGDIVWFPYHDSPKFQIYHDQLNALGYVRVMHKYYFNPLYLDLYMKPGAHVGNLSPMSSRLAYVGSDTAWKITPGGTGVQTNTLSAESATLSAGAQAVAVLPGLPRDVYNLGEINVVGSAGAQPAVGLQCLSSTNAVLQESAAVGAATGTTVPVAQVTVLCPPNTTALAVTLANKGTGTAQFSPITLYESGALK